MWRVALTAAADRAFRKLEKRDRVMAARIRDVLAALRGQENPHLFLKQLEGTSPRTTRQRSVRIASCSSSMTSAG